MATITDKGMQARPGTNDKWLIEAGARGEGRLVGRITPKGERRFYFRYTDNGGTQVRLLIGAFDPRGDAVATFTVQQARDRARDLSGMYRNGIRDLREHLAQQRADTQLAEEDARQAAATARREAAECEQAAALERERRLTVQQVFDRWCSVELKPHTRADGKRAGRKDGGQYTREQFGRYVFPTLGERAVVDVRKGDLMAVLDSTKAAGKLRTSNVLLADLKQMFRFALVREIVERNPLDTVSKRDAGGTEAGRERVLLTRDVSSLALCLPSSGMSRRSQLAVWLILATGCRIGELMAAQWQQVDMGAATWHLPDTKNQRPHTIHLSAFALRQFAALAELRQADPATGRPLPWVFPNTAGTGPVCIKSFGKQLADRQRPADRRMQHRSKATEALTLPGGKWTAHDLRRTAATLMAGLGVSGDVIDECLNHVIESRVRRTYIRDRRPVEQARAFDALGAKLAALVSGEAPGTNVVPLREYAA